MAAVVFFLGCGTAAREIQKKSVGSGTDVFTEIREGDSIPSELAGLKIQANIKTHFEGYYVGESSKSIHGKSEYPFLINIDGQVAIWSVNGFKDIKPASDRDGKTSVDPEARDGMKYVLEKRIKLRGGAHEIFFALTQENYFVKMKLILKQGEEYALEFKPVYRKKRTPRIPTFLLGISGYEVFLNGNLLKTSSD